MFVAGHPGTTERLLTVAQLKTQREPVPAVLAAALLGAARPPDPVLEVLARSGAHGEGLPRHDSRTAIKVRRMQLASLLDDRMMEQQRGGGAEAARGRGGEPEAEGTPAGAWDEIARAEATLPRHPTCRTCWIEGAAGFNSELFAYARVLVRAADERAKPNAERLREYTDARAAAAAAVARRRDPGLPGTGAGQALVLARAHARIPRPRPRRSSRQRSGTTSPDERAKALISGSKLADPKVRLALFEGGQAAVTASTDPMIALARAIDDEARALRKTVRDGGGGTRRARAAGDRRGALRGLRHQPLSGRDVHAAAVSTARSRAGSKPAMPRRALHPPRAAVRTRDRRAAVRAAEVVARREAAARHADAAPTSSRPTTSSAATRAARW